MGRNVAMCDKCLAKEELTVFDVNKRGYLSVFDGDVFHIVLCHPCCEELQVKPEWFDLEKCFIEEEGEAKYLYEENIEDLIKELVPEAQERINNCYNIFR